MTVTILGFDVTFVQKHARSRTVPTYAVVPVRFPVQIPPLQLRTRNFFETVAPYLIGIKVIWYKVFCFKCISYGTGTNLFTGENGAEIRVHHRL